ncbi:hypothetical protein C4K88_01355 [Arthrobacter pityocampae]|uniref:Glycosyl transferase family 1 domain-containing protein n=2 Tax=Arthrobacter pityocampae TaxID=547334 RepID=A0A2S5J2K1_9MICC|nr:hypothetical protein C4K88_01355 [Arthrobacter pityocampae]
MKNEEEMKFPELEAVFRLYSHYDRYVSVARAVSEKNRNALAERFSLEPLGFMNVDNQIHPEAVLTLAAAPLDADIEEWYSGARTNFLTIGRMSPEKDHAKLIRSFVSHHAQEPSARLLILGTGPLLPDLERLIVDLDATEFVWLAGQRSNPYPALARCDAFVLPSLHEGQPMVLFEAMILEKAIISTDVPGPREVLDGQYGLVVENSGTGLEQGFNALGTAEFPSAKFDHDAYLLLARNQFTDVCVPTSTVSSLIEDQFEVVGRK